MMEDRIGGVYRLQGAAIEGTGGVVTLTIHPDSSEVWILHWARAWHDDNGGSRTIEWYIAVSYTHLTLPTKRIV